MDFPRRPYAVENLFLERALREMQAVRFKMIWRKGEYLGGGGKYRGLTWPHSMEIAAGNPRWFKIFVHEYAHFRQNQEGLWASRKDWRHWESWYSWMAYELEPSAARLEQCCRVIQACELDAEKRAARLIRQYRFPSIDLAKFIQGANAYVLHYEACRHTRTYCKSNEAISAKFLKTVPQHFLRRYDRFPPGYYETYLADCSPRKLRLHMGTAVDA